MSPSRITAENVKNWMWFNGVRSLELWEKKAISSLDTCWMLAQNDATPKANK